MKNNLDIDLDELPIIDEKEAAQNRIKSALPNQQRRSEIFRSGSHNNLAKIGGPGVALSEANLAEMNGRHSGRKGL